MSRDEELEHLRQENQALQTSNQALREGLLEAIHAIECLQKQVTDLEGVIGAHQERIKTLEGQLSKDSHNSSLPPSSDRFVRVPKSLRTKSGKKPGGQPGHEGHALRQIEAPDAFLIHRVECCTHCHQNLETCSGRIAERRQVIDLPTKRLWVMEHQAEEKQCPICLHLTRASFPADVQAPPDTVWDRDSDRGNLFSCWSGRSLRARQPVASGSLWCPALSCKYRPVCDPLP